MSDKPSAAAMEKAGHVCPYRNEYWHKNPSVCRYCEDISVAIDAYAAERVREARLDEAKWWIRHLEEHGDEVLQSDRERIAQLERL